MKLIVPATTSQRFTGPVYAYRISQFIATPNVASQPIVQEDNQAPLTLNAPYLGVPIDLREKWDFIKVTAGASACLVEICDSVNALAKFMSAGSGSPGSFANLDAGNNTMQLIAGYDLTAAAVERFNTSHDGSGITALPIAGYNLAALKAQIPLVGADHTGLGGLGIGGWDGTNNLLRTVGADTNSNLNVGGAKAVELWNVTTLAGHFALGLHYIDLATGTVTDAAPTQAGGDLSQYAGIQLEWSVVFTGGTSTTQIIGIQQFWGTNSGANLAALFGTPVSSGASAQAILAVGEGFSTINPPVNQNANGGAANLCVGSLPLRLRGGVAYVTIGGTGAPTGTSTCDIRCVGFPI
jgi:hypothetical protein